MATALPCKLVVQLAFKAGGDLFHEIVANKPHDFVTASPGKFQSCQVLEGTPGTNGCIKLWNYTLDGKKQVAKTVLENVDMEKKTITYKWLEGDMLDLYKQLAVTGHVETKHGVDFATWTIEYELREPDTPHPLSFLNYHIEFINEIEAHVQTSAQASLAS